MNKLTLFFVTILNTNWYEPSGIGKCSFKFGESIKEGIHNCTGPCLDLWSCQMR